MDEVKHKAYAEKINDKVSFDMVPIPGGTFMMGSPDSEKGRDANEGPLHPVTVKPFWMAKLRDRLGRVRHLLGESPEGSAATARHLEEAR